MSTDNKESTVKKSSAFNLSRRGFLIAGAAVGGGLLIKFSLPTFFGPNIPLADAAADVFSPNGFIGINRAGEVTLVMPYVEMGQGTYTAIPMLIAEELEVDINKVKLEHAPANAELYTNPLLGSQTTGGSTTIRAAWEPMRQAGAAARTLLIAAAAAQWKVEPASCHAELGSVIHADSGRKLAYGELVDAAAKLPLPAADAIKLKSPADFKLIGTAAKRLDSPDKVNGAAKYGIDVQIPDMKIAAVATSPVFGGRVKNVDDSRALKVKGVRQIVRLDDGVAVIADHMGAAKKGLAALTIEWDEGEFAKLSSADIIKSLENASKNKGAVARADGDFAKAMAGAAQQVEAVYQVPFLAHAALEPMNCTVHLTQDKCDIWVGTQVIGSAQAIAAKITGLPLEKVVMHNFLLGGGFGRRLEVDGVERAVRIAQQVQSPVKVVWSREEDIQHDMYRPYFYDRMAAGLDKAGMPVAWNHRITGSSIMARVAPALFKDGFDPETIEGAVTPPYDLPNILVDFNRHEPQAIPTAFWRGVGPTHNIFMVESFIDELAFAAKQDPLQYRLALLDKNPRAKAVLQLAAEKAGWETKPAKGRGRGLSLQMVWGSYVAQVVELEVDADGEVKVHKVVCAVDCGIVVNPDTVQAQVEGGILFGITAALYGDITLKDGRVEQSNFHDYKMLRMNETPLIETHIVKSLEVPGGIGEPGTSALAPALANAVFAASGKRVRTLPVNSANFKKA